MLRTFQMTLVKLRGVALTKYPLIFASEMASNDLKLHTLQLSLKQINKILGQIEG